MEETRFFKNIWRFNAIVIMLVGILGIGMLLLAGYLMVKDITRDRNITDNVNIAEDQSVDEVWEFGSLDHIDRTPYIMVPLRTDQKYSRAYYSKSSHSVRNYLFINTETSDRYWLFQSNDYLIEDIDLLSEHEYDDRRRSVRAILYTVIEKDTNGDKRLNSLDDTILAISSTSGKDYKKILTGIDHMIGYEVLDKHKMLILYQKDGIGFSAYLNFSNFSLSNETELPRIKNTQN